MAAVLCLCAPSVHAQDKGHTPAQKLRWEKSAQAPVDEAWYGLYDLRNEYNPYKQWEISAPAQPKRNSAYAWGTTVWGEEVWFGTLNNGWSGWMYTHLKLPFQISSYETPYVGYGLVDYVQRGAQLYVYNTRTGAVECIDPAKYGAQFEKDYQVRLSDPTARDFSVRAAGTQGDVVFLIGHSTRGAQGEGFLRFFAFNAREKRYLGSADFVYDTARRMFSMQHPDGSNALYIFVGPDNTMGQAGTSKGAFLRWVGTPENPFAGGDLNGFDVVSDATLEQEGGMAEYAVSEDAEGRQILIASSWAHPFAVKDASKMGAGVFFTNPVPAAGFSKQDKASFRLAFRTDSFDADPVIGKTYENGAMTLHDGYLYWGTMHVAHSGGYDKLRAVYPEQFKDTQAAPMSDSLRRDLSEKSWRATHLFRIKLPITENARPELLYGDAQQWAFDPAKGWELRPNSLGLKPKFGAAGFGNPLNVYTWTAISHQDKLLIGTFDLYGGIKDYMDNATPDKALMPLPTGLQMMQWPEAYWKNLKANNPMAYAYAYAQRTAEPGTLVEGADLIVIGKHNQKPRVLSRDGLGNPVTNGIRNALLVGEELFLSTSCSGNLSELGGFHFYRMLMDKHEGKDKIGRALQLDAVVAYPNPTEGTLQLRSVQVMKEVRLFSIEGQQLAQQVVGANTARLDLSALQPGMYVVRVLLQDGSEVTRPVFRK